MKRIRLKTVLEEPKSGPLSLYTDYFIGQLLRSGVGCIEADQPHLKDGYIDFIYTSQKSSTPRIVARLSSRIYRSVLARIGNRCSPHMILGGHKLFYCKFKCNGQLRKHRFGVFLCNEPTMGCWLKIYLYCIDGVYPSLAKIKNITEN